MRVVALLLVVLVAGCLEGEARYFPDESQRIERLAVNAYQGREAGERAAHVEVRGLDAENTSRAFAGNVQLRLEFQDPAVQSTYTFEKAWSRAVVADDFASPHEPHFLFLVPDADLPHDGTYRVSVNATVAGRTLDGGSALFSYFREG